MNLPADVLIVPGGAGAAAAIAVATALAVASVRRVAFRWRGRLASSAVPASSPLAPPETPVTYSSEVPLLEGQYRSRSFRLSVNADGAIIVTLHLTRATPNALEIGAGALPGAAPFSTAINGRLERLPAPWSLAIRGSRLWLTVPGDIHDPLTIRRRLELACDLADAWETAR